MKKRPAIYGTINNHDHFQYSTEKKYLITTSHIFLVTDSSRYKAIQCQEKIN